MFVKMSVFKVYVILFIGAVSQFIVGSNFFLHTSVVFLF